MQTLATSFKETNDNGGQDAVATVEEEADSKDNHEDSRSLFTTGTSFMTADTESSELRVPDLSDMILDSVQLDYGDHIECPYCRTIQCPSNRHEWKKHVFRDLQPYVCIFQDCSLSFFESRGEWVDHAIKFHTRRWSCHFCPKSSQIICQKEADMVNHIKSDHFTNMVENQVPFLLAACEQKRDTMDTTSCPFCQDWDTNSEIDRTKEYCRHISKHLQLLALASIPMSIDGLEMAAEEEIRRNSTSESERGMNAANAALDTLGPPTPLRLVLKPFDHLIEKANHIMKDHLSHGLDVLYAAGNLKKEGLLALELLQPALLKRPDSWTLGFVNAVTQNDQIRRHSSRLESLLENFDGDIPGSDGFVSNQIEELQKCCRQSAEGIYDELEKLEVIPHFQLGPTGDRRGAFSEPSAAEPESYARAPASTPEQNPRSLAEMHKLVIEAQTSQQKK